MAQLCIIGPCHPYRGGIAHHTTLLGRALSAEHQVAVINFSRMYPDWLFPGKTQYDESEQQLQLASERLLDSISPPSWYRSAARLAELAPERVIFQWWHPFFAPAYRAVSARLRKLRPETRQVFLCHNVVPHESSVVHATLSWLGLGCADAFLLHSEAERPELERFSGARPVRVHPHPTYDQFAAEQVEPTTARERLGLQGDVLLFFGYVRAYKGLMTAIEALPAVLAQRKVTLVVAGEFYEEKSAYLERIRRLGIEEHVRLFDEYIPNERVADFFAAADVVVQPYVTATQSGISQLAFGFGKPVIATAVGGIPEVIADGRTGLLVPPQSPEQLAAAILRYFEQGLGQPMARNILTEREHNSWPSLARALLEI